MILYTSPMNQSSDRRRLKRSAAYFRQRAIEELHEAESAFSGDIRNLHVRWSHLYSEHMAKLSQ